MKKEKLLKKTCCLLATALAFFSTFESLPHLEKKALAADESGSESLKSYGVISRTASQNGGLIRYSYVDEEGNAIGKKSASAPEPTSGKSLRQAQDLPSSYDLRDEGYETPIKDQGVTGSCWAFAAIKAMESNSMINGAADAKTPDFSENHLAWYSYHAVSDPDSGIYGDKITQTSGFDIGGFNPFNPFSVSQRNSSTFAYDVGGNALTAVATLAQWSGAAAEKKAPFSADTYGDEKAMAKTMSGLAPRRRFDSISHLQGAYCLDGASDSDIKKAIMEYGALDISMYYDECGFDDGTMGGTSYYQTRYLGEKAQYAANHCVTAIGWDDGYSKSNFANQPKGDGAWLIANSYGDGYNDGGYFWLSYYEPSICDIYSFIAQPSDNYDNVLQYDGLGYNGAIYFKDKRARGANVFTADFAQTLKAVSFYTISDSQRYTIKIYKNLSKSSPTSGRLVDKCTVSGTAKYKGYHTVNLSSGCPLKKGENFSVVVTYKYSPSSGEQAYLPIEGETTSYSGLKYSYASKNGESYIYDEDELKWRDAKKEGFNNLCIKAFTKSSSRDKNTIKRTGAGKLSKKNIVLGKSESCKIKDLLGLSKDAAKSMRFVSSKKKVAAVDGAGKVRAKGVGKAVITAKIGPEVKASIKVVVKKAPSKIKIKPSGLRLKKGGLAAIKVFLPASSASYHIKYFSSNEKIAKVDSQGRVHGIKKGKAAITAKTYNNKKATAAVRVG